jgi:hypothetical protein
MACYEAFKLNFEKKLKTSIDLKNKFLFYCVFKGFVPNPNKYVNSFLRHKDIESLGSFGDRSVYYYSAFLTYIEKAY